MTRKRTSADVDSSSWEDPELTGEAVDGEGEFDPN
jgi:hypothetical protein